MIPPRKPQIPTPPPPPGTAELIASYVSLLIIQYSSQPDAQATIALLCGQAVASQIISQVLNGFDPTTAVGAQLDILANYVEVSREIVGYNTTGYFSMARYNDPLANTYPGFGRYTDATVSPYIFSRYVNSPSTNYVMSDPEMMSAILYFASLESLDLTIENIDAFITQFFGTYVTWTDNGNMTMTYTHDPSDPSTLFDIVYFLGGLPRPCGVQLGVD